MSLKCESDYFKRKNVDYALECYIIISMRKMSFCIGLLSLTLISGVVLTSSFVSATDDEVVDSVQLTVPIACTMTGTGTTHTATLNPGTYSGESGSEYENGIGKTTLTVICNDDNGFAIYAIGYTGNSYDSENHTKLVGTNTGGVIATKAYASGDTTSNWSMKLTKATDITESYNPQNLTIQSDTEGTFSSWHSVPALYTKVAEYHANTGSSTTDTTLGVKLETTYAAYIATNQPADVYVGQVKYTMVHPYTEEPLQPQPATSGCINYFANASNAIGTMGCQLATDGNSIDLLASNFSRTGYGFAGWSDSFDYATNPNAKFYGPQETITVPTGTTANGLSFYAVWIKSQGSIQDQSKVASVCSSLTTAPTDGTASLTSVSALTDQRDNNTYAIAKLADGKCWMIENLRLDNSATLTIANTNKPLNDGTNVTLKHSYSDTETYNTLSASQDPTTAAWCTSNTAYCDDRSMLFTGNTINRKTDSANNDGNIYSYGNYYNWYSATAGNGTTSKSSGEVDGDLCPSGWKLPLGNTSIGDIEQGASDAANRVGGFSYLDRKMGGTGASQSTVEASLRWRKYPINYLYSSYVYSGSLNNRGSRGYYWSSTAWSEDSAYSLYLGSSSVRPGISNDYGNKSYGRSVRCTAL